MFLIVMGILTAVICGVNYYLAHRLWQCLRYFFPGLPFWVKIILCAVLSLLLILGFARSLLPFSTGFKQVLGTVNAYWMGIFVYLLLFFLLADGILLLGKLFHLLPTPLPALVRPVCTICVAAFTALVVIYGCFHANDPQHVRYTVQTEKAAESLTIVLVSDLHLGSEGSETRLQTMVEQINDCSPDLVCIAGDLFDSDFSAIRDTDRVIQLLRSLSATFGVYACPGNHDAGSTSEQMWNLLEQSNVTLLADAYTVIDGRLILVGRSDSSPIGASGLPNRKPLEDILQDADLSLPVVVMDHNPAQAGAYPAQVDLVLCGHTHKGQIFPANLITNAIYTVDHGYHRTESGTQVIVTSGYGLWGPPMRVGTDSEIVSIFLSGKSLSQ